MHLSRLVWSTESCWVTQQRYSLHYFPLLQRQSTVHVFESLDMWSQWPSPNGDFPNTNKLKLVDPFTRPKWVHPHTPTLEQCEQWAVQSIALLIASLFSGVIKAIHKHIKIGWYESAPNLHTAMEAWLLEDSAGQEGRKHSFNVLGGMVSVFQFPQSKLVSHSQIHLSLVYLSRLMVLSQRDMFWLQDTFHVTKQSVTV